MRRLFGKTVLSSFPGAAWSLHSDAELDEVGVGTVRLLEALVVEALPFPGARIDGSERRLPLLLPSSDRDFLNARGANKPLVA